MSHLRSALRALRATPLVTGAALCSLALGIGANSAIFSIVDALILKPLPVAHADRLSVLESPFPNGGFRRSWTNPIWEEIRSRQDQWDGAFAAGFNRFNASAAGETDPIDGAFVSGRYFEVMGVQPVLGRLLTVDDDRRGGGGDGPVVVISHRLWRQRFAGASDIVGRGLQLDKVSFTVVGVAAPSFFGHSVGIGMDVWVPLGTEPLIRGPESTLDRRSTWWLQVYVRRASGQSSEAASARLATMTPGIREATLPQDWQPANLARYLAEPMQLSDASGGVSNLRTRYQRPLIALAVVVGLTLLIACGNIANLMLARASARRHEFALRTALGATRGRLAGELLVENLLLSLSGAVLGLGVAAVATRLIVRQISTSTLQVALDTGLDLRMLGFTAGVAVLTTLLFGVGPALLATRTSPMAALKEQGRGTTSGKQRVVANGLVLAQVTLSLLLVVGAGLFVRSFVGLADVKLGFVPDQALVMTVSAQRTETAPDQRLPLFEAVLASVQETPGVTAAALSVLTPVSGSTWNGDLVFAHKPDLSEEDRIVDFNYVTPGWFATYGTTLLRGRDFDSRDHPTAPQTAVVNEAFVKKYFEGLDPIGQVVSTPSYPGSPGGSIEIIGVVEDAVYRTPREPLGPTMYRAYRQVGRLGAASFVTLRTARGDRAALQAQLTQAITSVNPDLTVAYRELGDFVHAALVQERLIAMLSGFFGALALLLAAIGLYGITAHGVLRRRAEIGIRLALGATPARVVREILSRTGLLVLTGIIAGGAASWWLSRFVAALLFGIQPTDAATIAGAMLVLAAVSAVAAWVPARRAALVEPLEALRDG